MWGARLVSKRLYGALLYLYPKQFRGAFGPQMQQTFRAACQVAYQRHGAVGLLVLWLPTLLDLFVSALGEWARQGKITMEKDRRTALAGPLTIVIGVLWLSASVGEMVLLFGLASPDTFWDSFWLIPISLSFILMIPAFIITRRRFHTAAGAAGRLGLILSIAGGLGIWSLVLFSILIELAAPALDDGAWPNYVIAVGILTIMIGHMLFGIDALRNRLLPRWNVLPLLVGLPTVLLAVPTLIIENSMPRDFHWVLITTCLRFALTGLGWVLLGMVMLDQTRRPEPAAAM